MPRNCWCYTVNEKYMLPALVSAMQLRTYIDQETNFIIVLIIGEDSEICRAAAAAMAQCGINITVVKPSIMNGYPLYCARLFLNSIINGLDAEFIIYVDADTQFVGDIMELATSAPDSGSIIAVPDVMSIVIDHPSKSFREHAEYFTKIGLPKDAHRKYFNSGIMKFRPSDWETISKECLKYLRLHEISQFRYPDQDVLNIVMDGRQNLASFKWNFPAFFLGRGLEDIVKPSILHFMSRPRPWNGPFQPWGQPAYQPYLSFVEEFPELKSLLSPFANVQTIRYIVQQFFKARTEPWGTPFIRERVALIEDLAFV